MLDQRATHARALRQFTDPAPGYWSELIVRSVGRMDRGALGDVRWLETAGNYVELHLPQRGQVGDQQALNIKQCL